VIGLLKAELRKLAKRRVYWVMIGILALVVGLVAFVFFVLPGFIPEGEIPQVRKPEAYLLGAQQVMSQNWFPTIMAVMLLGGELATTAWAAALTRNSRRYQHLLARLVVVSSASWLAMVAAVAGISVVVAIFAEGSGAPSPSEWWGIVWKLGVGQLTGVALAFAAAAWLRSVGPAIGATIAFGFADGIASLWRPWRQISLVTLTSALIGPVDIADVQVGFFAGFTQPISFSRALVVVLIWTVAAIAAAAAGLQVRDP
jgi:hypothetical protein